MGGVNCVPTMLVVMVKPLISLSQRRLLGTNQGAPPMP